MFKLYFFLRLIFFIFILQFKGKLPIFAYISVDWSLLNNLLTEFQ